MPYTVQPKGNVALVVAEHWLKSGHGTCFNCEPSSHNWRCEDSQLKWVPCLLFIDLFAVRNCVNIAFLYCSMKLSCPFKLHMQWKFNQKSLAFPIYPIIYADTYDEHEFHIINAQSPSVVLVTLRLFYGDILHTIYAFSFCMTTHHAGEKLLVGVGTMRQNSAHT